jgi:tetratricopeptide (TPR) repeat protein
MDAKALCADAPRMPAQPAITFVIPGHGTVSRGGNLPPAPPSGGLPGRVKTHVKVGARRAGGSTIRAEAVPGQDLVVLHLANGPDLVLNPETARDLLMGQSVARRSGGAPSGDVPVPTQLRWQGLEQAAPGRTRGFLGDVLLQAVEIITDVAGEPAADFLTSRVVAHVDGQVDPGVYLLQPETLGSLKARGGKLDEVPACAEPMLVLLHGTFVDTASTFSPLWTMHPGSVRALFRHYRDRVYALDHPTLGASPIANALALASTLPDGARLHLATHSRGGLVAEVLARVCGQNGELSTEDLAHFDGTEYLAQRDDLLALAARVKTRGLKVERVLRVACPMRGTLLASRRLDAYVSVLRWSLQLAGVPVAPALLDFLGAVARRREDPMQLPGLAAMLPTSPLVKWLNASPQAIPGELRVLAGDLEGDSMGSWVKTLLADAFFWTDNDLVVQTRSMYGGAARQGGTAASFLLDQGGKVTHFNYFSNERTVAALVSGLVQDQPTGFRPIGPLSWAGADAGGVRAARERRADAPPPAERPAVFLLPGILGSHLKVDGERVWLSLRLLGGLERLAWQGGAPDGVTPDGPIGLFYDDLAGHLEASHEVIPFAFDWRRPIEDEALRLAAALERELDLRDASRQPVRLIAHSMGGVVARTVQLVAPAVWDRLMARDGARLLMLGTPNGGSWAPMQVLSGDDSFGNTLAALGAPFQDHRARQTMAEMPGFLQLQAGLRDDDEALARHETWRRLADDDLETVRQAAWWHRNWLAENDTLQLTPYRWGVPPQDVLNQALALRKRLDLQRDRDLPAFADRLLLVAGQARFTPDGWHWAERGLEYLNATDGGDGRVPLPSALLPGVRTWSLDCEHGSLPDHAEAFAAYVELLQRGDTALLQRLPTPTRGAPAATVSPDRVPSRPSRGRPAPQPAETMKALLAAPSGPAAEMPAPVGGALRVAVVNGDLAFIRQPILVGHYRSGAVTGTEAVIDRMLGGVMKTSLQSGLYPQNTGEHQIFVNTRGEPDNPWQAPRPEAAIVIGLGDEGGLKPGELSAAVRQAALAWSQRLAERGDAAATIELAATLMGSGGLGVHPADSACALARGVRDAAEIIRQGNAQRRRADGDRAVEWPVITTLTLVELYLERASDAWRGLQVQATATPGHYEIAPTVASGMGPLRRQIDIAYRGARYDLISAESGDSDTGVISFRLDTRRARTEVRAVALQVPLVRQLVRRAAHEANDDPRLGRTLFQLLVPEEMEPFLGGTNRMVLELDEGTSTLPWELLDPPAERRAGGDPRPWSVRTRLLRKLRKTRFRTRVRDAGAEDHVLVVGEPALTDARYGALPGALAEGRAVRDELQGTRGVGGQRVRLVEHGTATQILNALFERPWRIVHIAGHGEPGALGGLVMSDGSVLGPREIGQMRTVPELVFVNCCHLAGRDGAALAGGPERDLPQFAASVADALIEAGVRCVVAAGWAVDDEAAALFARGLYRELLEGRCFIDAVAQAREEAWRQSDTSAGGDGNNTWAAYQCYGDPDWTFRRATGDAQAPEADTMLETYEGISSPLGLALALEKLAVETKFQHRERDSQLEHLRHLEARFGALWGAMGAVAEAFGLAYAEAGAFAQAIAWYERATQAQDGSASMKAPEQWLNLRVRVALDEARAADTPDARHAARARIEAALRQLEALTALQPSIERHSLCGSAWKRMAMLAAQAGDRSAEGAARLSAAKAYEAAETLALAVDPTSIGYPGQNRMATALAAHDGPAGWPGFDPDRVARVRQSLQQRCLHDPDFWTLVGMIEVDAFEAAAAGRMAPAVTRLVERAHDLRQRAQALKSWASVADTAEFALARWHAHARGAEKAALGLWLQTLRGFAGR